MSLLDPYFIINTIDSSSSTAFAAPTTLNPPPRHLLLNWILNPSTVEAWPRQLPHPHALSLSVILGLVLLFCLHFKKRMPPHRLCRVCSTHNSRPNSASNYHIAAWFPSLISQLAIISYISICGRIISTFFWRIRAVFCNGPLLSCL